MYALRDSTYVTFDADEPSLLYNVRRWLIG